MYILERPHQFDDSARSKHCIALAIDDKGLVISLGHSCFNLNQNVYLLRSTASGVRGLIRSELKWKYKCHIEIALYI